jgi:hypothetical protein
MRRFVLGAAAFLVLALGGMFSSTAEAHGPSRSHYRGGGWGHGHGHAPHCYYGGPPVRSYYRGPVYGGSVVPYGGYYPSSGMSYRSPGFGLYLGF